MKHKLENGGSCEELKKGSAPDKTESGKSSPLRRCDAIKPEVVAEDTWLMASLKNGLICCMGCAEKLKPGYAGVSAPVKNTKDKGPVKRSKQHSHTVSLLMVNDGPMTRKEKFFAVPFKKSEVMEMLCSKKKFPRDIAYGIEDAKSYSECTNCGTPGL
uniref:Protein FAM60A n=1 Tax=Rhabditophanes sp. KR3021 TaxID=114890 RepID=A0AC35U3P0_9BILA